MDEETLLAKHRQERKELQAKITALKKTIPKNDKKGKKEIADQISRLEEEMKDRHEKQVRDLSSSVTIEEEASSFVEKLSNLHMDMKLEEKEEKSEFESPRISKAQRKRDKKAQKEREKQNRITIESQELELNSDRKREDDLMKNILNKNGLKLYDIPSDGDCLFKAIEHQLSLRGINTHVSELRRKCSEELRKRKDEFLPFLANPDSDELLSDTDYEKYCQKIENTKFWGGNIELQALSNVLSLPITVIQAFGPSVEIGAENFKSTEPLLLSYHRHALQLGEHYNSVIKEKS